ncbi:MAG: short-chain dehydrogenase/reductase [Sphingomonadales bacterium]|nr:short-chain dehydrogenase/reductase [Sphingomonadales bacterium]
MDLGLKGRKVIIGGALRGISKAITEVLAAEGADIAIFTRQSEGLEAQRDALAKHGGNIIAETFTLEDRDGYKAFLTGLADKLGGADIFIHSISSSGAQATMDWEQSFKIDMMGAVDGCEALEPYLEKSGTGSVILMSSTAALETFLMPQAFNAVKAALIVYGKQLSQAWGPKGIRVNMVSPGPTSYPGGNWEGAKAAMPEFYDSIVSQFPLGRFGTPQDVAPAVAFLASPLASFITGANIVIDGGFTKRVQF